MLTPDPLLVNHTQAQLRLESGASTLEQDNIMMMKCALQLCHKLSSLITNNAHPVAELS